jgi:hypothetical protein
MPGENQNETSQSMLIEFGIMREGGGDERGAEEKLDLVGTSSLPGAE